MQESVTSDQIKHPGEVLLKERGCAVKKSPSVIRLEFDHEFQTADVYEYLTRILPEEKR